MLRANQRIKNKHKRGRVSPPPAFTPSGEMGVKAFLCPHSGILARVLA